MARLTVEEAVKKVGNRFDLVLLASKRARQLSLEGKEPLVDAENDKPTVIALREIEEGLMSVRTLEEQERKARRDKEMAELAVVNIISDGHGF